jgi:CheY-like chemotaxis protein
VGSTFTFTVRVRLPEQPVAHPSHQRETLLGLRGRRVLVVDDNASAREILALMVRQFGMQTEVTHSGALSLLALKTATRRGEPFDLVLMDWRMPGMDGLEAARLIKSDAALSCTPAVLMVTAFGREEILQRAEQLNLEGVLIKPVTDSVLFNTIAEALGCAHAEPEARGRTPRSRVPEERGVPGLVGRRVLIVDDNALNREVATDFLLAAGMQVEAAVGGLDALERLRCGGYDIVLMDVHMPEVDGLMATREIRKEPRFARLPIIALTAQAQASDRGASLAAGMNAHLTKPIDEATLYATMVQLLSNPRASAVAASAGGNGAEATQQTVAAVDDPAWPSELPGIDLSVALARLGGRHDRVLRFLRGFVRDFADAPTRLADDQAVGRCDGIASIAHTVKSAAGYLGAADLSEAAERLEAAARLGDGGEAMAERVMLFRGYLDAVLAGLHALFAQTPPARPAAAGAIDEHTIALLIAEAEPLVSRGDYAALALLDEIAARLAGTPALALAEAARDQFEEVELESSAATLRELHAALAPPAAEDRA